MLAIKNNLMAANAARYLGQSYDALASSVERLSSGLRINSASDDAAGMAVRELMRADIAVLEQGARNAQDGVSMLQTMEGAMQIQDNLLVRMQQLAEQAATGSYSSAQRVIMDNEFDQLTAEIERIATSTDFNGIKMLDNSATVSVHFGGASDKIDIVGSKMTKVGLGISALSITTAASAARRSPLWTAPSTPRIRPERSSDTTSTVWKAPARCSGFSLRTSVLQSPVFRTSMWPKKWRPSPGTRCWRRPVRRCCLRPTRFRRWP